MYRILTSWMYQDQILNSKYVWSIFVIRARIIPPNKYIILITAPDLTEILDFQNPQCVDTHHFELISTCMEK